MDLPEVLKRQAEIIDAAVLLIEDWINEAHVKLAWHSMVNVSAVLKGEAYVLRTAAERNETLYNAASILLGLAGKHTDYWTQDDYIAFGVAKGAIERWENEGDDDVRNIFGYTEDGWRVLPDKQKTALMQSTENEDGSGQAS
jgi:hypothetical protein